MLSARVASLLLVFCWGGICSAGWFLCCCGIPDEASVSRILFLETENDGILDTSMGGVNLGSAEKGILDTSIWVMDACEKGILDTAWRCRSSL